MENVIELKSIKHYPSMSEETDCYQANVYFNKTLIGYCKNDGRGGNTLVRPDSEKVLDLFREAQEWCKTLPPHTMECGFEIKMNMENYVDSLFTEWLKMKEMKKVEKLYKDHICYKKVSNDSEIRYNHFTNKNRQKISISELLSNPLGRQMLKDFCEKKMSEGYEILNTNIPTVLLNQ